MFIDEVKIYVKAGDGGDGCNSFYRDKFTRRGRPDGGDGGDGGDVIFKVDSNVHTLLDFKYQQHLKAESGSHGSSNNKAGRRGQDLSVRIPPGTIIKDFENGLVLRDLVKEGEGVAVAKGGQGGKGNSRNRPSEEGAPGEEKTLLLELKLIADVGIIGYPNAGKSTLISKISSARPKIASYPFTTKEPVLGVVKVYDTAFVVAEVPGLIEGAHEGRGLGDRFLRHIERTNVLIHLVDIAGFEGRDPCKDYVSLNEELKAYNKELMKRPQVVALNKIDMPDARSLLKIFKKTFPRIEVFPISALAGNGTKELLAAVHKKLKGLKKHGKA